jgi:hypothetical protein
MLSYPKVSYFMGVKIGLCIKGEYRLRVIENRVLRRLFGVMRVELTGGRRRLHNE